MKITGNITPSFNVNTSNKDNISFKGDSNNNKSPKNITVDGKDYIVISKTQNLWNKYAWIYIGISAVIGLMGVIFDGNNTPKLSIPKK